MSTRVSTRSTGTGGLAAVAAVLEKIALGLRMIAGLVIVLIMLITGYDVLMRYVFLRPLEWSLTIAMLGLVIAVLFTVPHITAVNTHISMDLFYRRFSPGRQRLADIITMVTTLVFSLAVGVVACLAAWDFLTHGLRTAGTFNIPIWYGYAVVSIGFLLTALIVLVSPWRREPAQGAEEMPSDRSSDA